MNRWGIPSDVERTVRTRDKRCVYCGIAMKIRGPRKKVASWEHIDNDGPNSDINVALCCGGCNSSKGEKNIAAWLASEYCKKKGINARTVAPVVKNWLKHRAR